MKKIIHYKFFGTHQIVHVEKRLFNFTFFRIWFFISTTQRRCHLNITSQWYYAFMRFQLNIKWKKNNNNRNIFENRMQMLCLCRTLTENSIIKEAQSSQARSRLEKKRGESKKHRPNSFYYFWLVVRSHLQSTLLHVFRTIIIFI